MTTAPDLVEPIVGWRTWRVAETPSGLRLWSVIYDDGWEPQQPFAARCGAGEAHAAPDAHCTCGVYGSLLASEAARYVVGRDDPLIACRVVGLVALWGQVYEGVRGWRGELAYPVRLYVPAGPRDADVASGLREYGAALAVEPVTRTRDVRTRVREVV